MDCDEFLEGYSDFRDRRLAPPEGRRFREHFERCDSCRRYDHVLRRGVRVLRSLPSPRSSCEFLPRLKHRIYHVDDGIPVSGSSGASSALAALATVGLLALAWLPFALQPPAEVELDPVAVPTGGASRPSPAPGSLFGSGPFLTPMLRESARSGPETGEDGWSAAEMRGSAPILLRGRSAPVTPAALRIR